MRRKKIKSRPNAVGALHWAFSRRLADRITMTGFAQTQLRLDSTERRLTTP